MFKVLRLVEYTYRDAQAMNEDMANHTHNIRTPKVTVRSTYLFPKWEEDNAESQNTESQTEPTDG